MGDTCLVDNKNIFEYFITIVFTFTIVVLRFLILNIRHSISYRSPLGIQKPHMDSQLIDLVIAGDYA